MKRNVLNSVRVAAPVMLAVLALGPAAVAGKYPGSQMTLTNGAGNTRDLFTVSGNGITVTGDTLLNGNKYYLTGTSLAKTQLVGFRSIYLVKTNGTATSGVTTMTSGGYSVESGTLTKTYYDGALSMDGYTGYDDGGDGFSNGSKWVVIADPTLAGKEASNQNTSGSFGFSSSSSSSSSVTNYDIGLDYILKGGQTGRAYFALPAPRVPAAVPEPGSLASLALGSLCLGGLILNARKRSAKAA